MGNWVFTLGDTNQDTKQKALTCIYSFDGVVSVRYYAQMNAFCVFGEGIKETEIQKKIDELYNPKPKTRYLFGCIPM
ncbi:hypothetical protein AtNW77_Chr1g0058851 [Arabidopsis thaliana]|uniref:Uncharacterized protein n=2 Tax=Arabidopsis thaliana TaxID=3702 RepID=A0A654EPK7_ARATH|nr:uncharacterized protein AT1G59723 [Arabidopsis thaliana]ANM60840.1 hypothetical protein AT1G59723 [Arabidopsis thaliana]CAA0303009.1 unnamed protein product [Arabidopsis thaliana]VYS49472.1 unnamed protein product [Arabidopsis thaliana]|eukprot:NP_001323096.1 hypothetical protein AT1G59723 [Arabidopsis thaliana]